MLQTKKNTREEKPEQTPEELREAAARALEDARKITDEAIAAERELTSDEFRRYESLMSKARLLEARVKQMKGSGNFGTSPGDITSLFGTGGSGPAARAVRGGWGKAIVRQALDEYGRFKGLTPSGTVLVNIPAPAAVQQGMPVASLRSLIPAEQTNGMYAFLRQTLRTNNAAPVGAGALKPTSEYEYERVEERARVIAHLSQPIARQDIADAPLIEVISSEMAFGLEMALTAQILAGTGVGENLTGLNATPGVQTSPLLGATALNKIQTLRRAIVGLEGTGWVMAPSDWEAIELLADSGGALMLQGADQRIPIDSAARRLFGIPVVATPSCTPGVAWLADFTGSTKLYVREEARLDWSENTWDPDALGSGLGASDFARNLIRFRCEGRFGFAVTRPSGVVKISLA
jgi:HK97 family phage major capsid protein